jgi:NAD(P)-dependent dehydrogenase (short-subunit alcohol dehydrogenase family)
MDLGLAGRVAVVTGASRGIGKACAAELAAESADADLAQPGPCKEGREVGAVGAFLVSERASFVIGTAWAVDGGTAAVI